MPRRYVALILIVLLFAAAGMLLFNSKTGNRVSFKGALELWADLVRDLDNVGLTLTRVSTAEETKLGNALSRIFAKQIIDDVKLTEYVTNIGHTITANVRRKRIRYHFKIIDIPTVNAFALPGGHVYITRRMLDFAKSEAEVAAIVAHEVSHIDLRHCIERFQYELLLRKVLPQDFASLIRIAHHLMRLSYSEQQEIEADNHGLVLMARAGYHPKHGFSIHDRFRIVQEAKVKKRRPSKFMLEEIGSVTLEGIKDYLATHPGGAERLAALSRTIARNESQWTNRRFYAGVHNHQEKIARNIEEYPDEWRPYREPPILRIYLSDKRYADFKALAINLLTGSGSVGANAKTLKLAEEAALSNCNDVFARCQLYAIGNVVIAEASPEAVRSVRRTYAESGRNRLMLQGLDNYENTEREFKALAIHPDYGFWAISSYERTPAEAIVAAIRKCSEPQLTCRLYYLGDKLLYDEPEVIIEDYKKQYAIEVINRKVKNKLHKFLTEPKYRDFKAFAYDNESGRVYYAWGYKWHPRLTAKRVVHRCERRARKCDLVAVGNTIVFGEPRQKIDRIIDEYFRRIAGPSGLPLPLQAYLKKWHPHYKVLVVDGDTGSHYTVSGQIFLDRAIQKALEMCRRKRSDCQVFAVGDVIVHGKPNSERDRLIDEYRRKIADHYIKEDFEDYLKDPMRKDCSVLVVDLRSGVTMRAEGKGNVQHAIAEAEEACVAIGTTCELYAVGNERVIGLSDEQRKLIIRAYENKAYKLKDKEMSVVILKRLAATGDRRAAFLLAEMFEFADGVSKSDIEAARYYLIAAEANDPTAQLRIAGRYEHGRGVRKSLEESLKWYIVLRNNPEASVTQKRSASSHVRAFHSVYVMENSPGSKELLHRAEAKARAWRPKMKAK